MTDVTGEEVNLIVKDGERNVLIGTAGKFGNVLKIRPPLAFQREHADIFLEAFNSSLAEIS